MQTDADPLCQQAASLYAEYVARQNLASQAHELSPEDLRRTWSVVDVLTALKRNTNHRPTAALIRRKVDALSLPALDKLGCLVDLTILQRHGHHLSTRHYHGFQLAINSFPNQTATEVALVHSRREVISAAAIDAVRFESGHILRLGIESITTAQKHGIPLHPIATDRHARAMAVLHGKQDSEAAALEVLGIEDAVVLEGRFLTSSKSLLTGAAFCLAVLEELEHTASICCGRCGRAVDVAELSICGRCGDQLVCNSCGRCCGRHDGECDRVRGIARAMAKSLLPSLRESARHVAVVQLDARGGMVPMHISKIGSPLTPSSLWETISRCSVVADAVVYWRLLVAFLAEPDGDEQVCIIGHEEGDLYRAKPVECATVEKQPTSPPEREAPTLTSERRRLQKEAKAAEKRAQGEARAAAEAAAVAEADAVLERQSARPDATSAMLTSVLLKRGGSASPEVVARARAKRDLLKATEMRARKPAAKATPIEPNAADRLRTDGVTNMRLAAAALLLQRRARAWLRSRKKLRRKQRSRAGKLIQRSVRTWLVRVLAKPYSASAGASSGSESADAGEPEPPEPEPPRPASTDASTEPAAAECTICLDGNPEYAVVPCGHRCLCASCIKVVSECPVCRGVVTAVLRVFI